MKRFSFWIVFTVLFVFFYLCSFGRAQVRSTPGEEAIVIPPGDVRSPGLYIYGDRRTGLHSSGPGHMSFVSRGVEIIDFINLGGGLEAVTPTTGTLAKFLSSSTIGDSLISDDGTDVTIAGPILSSATFPARNFTSSTGKTGFQFLSEGILWYLNDVYSGIWKVPVLGDSSYTFSGTFPNTVSGANSATLMTLDVTPDTTPTGDDNTQAALRIAFNGGNEDVDNPISAIWVSNAPYFLHVGAGANPGAPYYALFKTELLQGPRVIVFPDQSGDVPLVDATNETMQLGTKTFSALPTSDNGTVLYCSDCTIGASCSGSGTGALAIRLNGAWVCN